MMMWGSLFPDVGLTCQLGTNGAAGTVLMLFYAHLDCVDYSVRREYADAGPDIYVSLVRFIDPCI